MTDGCFRIWDKAKLVIGQVNGYCLAGGTTGPFRHRRYWPPADVELMGEYASGQIRQSSPADDVRTPGLRQLLTRQKQVLGALARPCLQTSSR